MLQNDLQFITFPEMHGQILASLQAVVRAAKPTAGDRNELEEYDKVALFNTLMHKPLYCVQLMEKFAQEYPESAFSFGEDMKADIMEVKKLALEAALNIAGNVSTPQQNTAGTPVTVDMANQFFGRQAGVSPNSTAAKLAECLKHYPNMTKLQQASHTTGIPAALTQALRQTEAIAQSKGATKTR